MFWVRRHLVAYLLLVPSNRSCFSKGSPGREGADIRWKGAERDKRSLSQCWLTKSQKRWLQVTSGDLRSSPWPQSRAGTSTRSGQLWCYCRYGTCQGLSSRGLELLMKIAGYVNYLFCMGRYRGALSPAQWQQFPSTSLLILFANSDVQKQSTKDYCPHSLHPSSSLLF